MAFNQVGRFLYRLAKNGEKEAFLKFIEQHKVFSKLNSFDATNTSYLIYAFSALKIVDRKIWQTLETSFLIKEKSMNCQDIAFCASAFGKTTQNPKVWKRVEEYVEKNFGNITSTQDIVMLFYGTAHSHYDSPSIWHIYEKLCSENLLKFNQKELTMMIWSFCRVNKGSKEFWDYIEEIVQSQIQFIQLQNQSIVVYSFSKMQKGKVKFWDIIEKAVLASLNKVNYAKPQDIANLAWGFANIGKGSDEFWNKIEKITKINMDKFSLLDISNTAWSLLSSNRHYPEFWPNFYSFLKKFDKVEDKNTQDIIMLVETLTQVNCTDKELWVKMAKIFNKFMKEGKMDNLMYKASWHKKLFEAEPKIWDNQIEDIYLNSIQRYIKNNIFLATQNLLNVCLCAAPNFGSNKFWGRVVEMFLEILENPQVTSKDEIIYLVSKTFYTLSVKLITDNEKSLNLLEIFNEKIDKFYRNEEKFLEMTKNKRNFIYQLKGMVHQQVNTHQRTFWSQLKNHNQEFSFLKPDIELLIFAIIVKNRLFFERQKIKELENNIEKYCNTHGKEGIENLTKYLFHLLLSYYSDNKFVCEEFETDPLLKELKLTDFLRKPNSQKEHQEFINDHHK